MWKHEWENTDWIDRKGYMSQLQPEAPCWYTNWLYEAYPPKSQKSHTIKILVRSRKSHRSRKIPEKSLKKKRKSWGIIGGIWEKYS